MRARNGTVELAVSFGGPTDGPVVLLVSPADSPAFRWTPAVVEPLANAGFGVVRFDQRDVGASSTCEAPYTLEDLVADAIAVLDAVGAERAHVIGRSMGGMVGQMLALDHSDRVASLTVIGSTPSFGDDKLSSASDGLVEKLTWRLLDGPPIGRAERVEWVVDGYRTFAGTRFPFEAKAQRSLALREVDECWRPDTGHGVAVADTASWSDRLAAVGCPTLVVHGTADPVFGPDHAIALADAVPDATLCLVEGLGHELPDAFAPAFVERWFAVVGGVR